MAKKEAPKKETKKAPAKKEVVIEKRPILSRSDIIASVAEMNDLSKADAENAVLAVFDTIKGALLEGNDVQVHGFGKFFVKDVPARQAHNPKTGEKIQVEATKKMGFKPAANVKAEIKEC
jgi:DNA-binding protein HU-beta